MSRFLRRLCLATDIESYSSHTNPEQIDAQRRLTSVMQYACHRAGIVWVRRQKQGDGQLLVLKPGIDEARVVPALILGLRHGLYEANRAGGPFGRIRMRAALGQGTVATAANGYVGKTVVAVTRLIDAPELRQSLSTHTACDLALAVTDDLFDDVLTQGYPGLRADEFTHATLSVPGKHFSAEAWIHLPSAGPAPDRYSPDVGWTQLMVGGAITGGALIAITNWSSPAEPMPAAAPTARSMIAPSLGAVVGSSLTIDVVVEAADDHHGDDPTPHHPADPPPLYAPTVDDYHDINHHNTDHHGTDYHGSHTDVWQADEHNSGVHMDIHLHVHDDVDGGHDDGHDAGHHADVWSHGSHG